MRMTETEPQLPVIQSVSPRRVRAGDLVTIDGEHLENTQELYVGGIPAEFVVVNKTTVRFPAPDLGIPLPKSKAFEILLATDVGTVTANLVYKADPGDVPGCEVLLAASNKNIHHLEAVIGTLNSALAAERTKVAVLDGQLAAMTAARDDFAARLDDANAELEELRPG